MRTKQKEVIMELLRDRPDKFIPVWWFIGEKYLKSLDSWVMLSHRGPARLTDLFQDGLVERRMVKGLNGARYYEYKYLA